MNQLTAEQELLINPPEHPSGPAGKCADHMSLLLPAFAALLSIGAGVAGWLDMGKLASVLGGLGGVLSALGIIATGRASKIRDRWNEYVFLTAQSAFLTAHEANLNSSSFE